MKLKFYKMYKDVVAPKFATEGSACFDVCAYIRPEEMEITVYTMDNLKIKRKPEWYNVQHGPKNRFRLSPAERILIPTGLILDIPDGHSVRLHTRSSVSLKRGLIMPNGEGIIDADYYHETFVMFYNASADEVRITDNERIAQGELIFNENCSLKETKEKPTQKTERVGGFGSTGVS